MAKKFNFRLWYHLHPRKGVRVAGSLPRAMPKAVPSSQVFRIPLVYGGEGDSNTCYECRASSREEAVRKASEYAKSHSLPGERCVAAPDAWSSCRNVVREKDGR